MDRSLVIANQTLGGEELMSAIRQRAAAGAWECIVVVPLTPLEDYAPEWMMPLDPGLEPPMLDPDSAGGVLAADRAREHAERRLKSMLERIRTTGTRAEGHIGDPDPVAAAVDALEEHEVGEIILSTLPATLSRWLGMDLPSQLRRRTGLPVVTVEPRESPAAAGRAPSGGQAGGRATGTASSRQPEGAWPGVWDHHRFVAEVQQACGLDRRQARRMIRAALETLGETLSASETRRLRGRLPAELSPYLGAEPSTAERMEVLSEEEFVRRVRIRSEAGEGRPTATVTAVEALIGAITAATGLPLSPGSLGRSRSRGARKDSKQAPVPGLSVADPDPTQGNGAAVALAAHEAFSLVVQACSPERSVEALQQIAGDDPAVLEAASARCRRADGHSRDIREQAAELLTRAAEAVQPLRCRGATARGG